MVRTGRGRWWILTLALVLGLAVGCAVPRGQGRVSVVGDGAGPVTELLDGQDAAIGVVSVVLLRRPGSLEHLPEVARLCRGRCSGGLTILHELRPTGAHRWFVVDLRGVAGAVAALDQGRPLPPQAAGCIANVVRAEATARFNLKREKSCLPDGGWALVLPYGL